MKATPTHGRSVAAAPTDPRQIQLGLRANWQQFTLLVLVNAFVGGMVGLERDRRAAAGRSATSAWPPTVILSFIVSFGVVKALANLFAGRYQRPPRPQAHPGRRLAVRPAGAVPGHLRPELGAGWSSPTSCWGSTRGCAGRRP